MLDDTEVAVLTLHVGGLGLYGHLLVNRDNNIIWLYALLTLNREGSRKGDLPSWLAQSMGVPSLAVKQVKRFSIN